MTRAMKPMNNEDHQGQVKDALCINASEEYALDCLADLGEHVATTTNPDNVRVASISEHNGRWTIYIYRDARASDIDAEYAAERRFGC